MARLTQPGPRPVHVYRLEERNLRTGAARILVGGRPDLDRLLEIFYSIITEQARRGGTRYEAPDPPYRLLVISDGWQPAVNQAGTMTIALRSTARAPDTVFVQVHCGHRPVPLRAAYELGKTLVALTRKARYTPVKT
jgi:hypothetical protein